MTSAAVEGQRERRRRQGDVQTVERAFGLLETTADAGGALGLSQLSNKLGIPLTTSHRLLHALVELGYMRQQSSGSYVLGPRLITLGAASSMTTGVWRARPHLTRLVEAVGESASLAMLNGDEVVYVAQVPSPRSMRMIFEVGHRVPPHSTTAGKAIMSTMVEHEVHELLARTGMPRHTEATPTDLKWHVRQVELAGQQGYALDDGEHETGVLSIAVAVPDAPTRLALSLAGPAERMPQAVVETAIQLLIQTARSLAQDLR